MNAHRRVRTRVQRWLHTASIWSCIVAGLAVGWLIYHAVMLISFVIFWIT